MQNLRNSFFVVLARLSVVAIALGATALSGCGSGVATNSITPLISQLHGTVMGGKGPVPGAQVQIYTASLAGRGSAATPLAGASVVTDNSGKFYLNLPPCLNATDQEYLITSGGQSAAPSKVNLVLMSALGDCGNLRSSPAVIVNEATTIASVYGLAPYMNTATYDVAANSNEGAALTSAFNTVRTLVDLGTGTSISTNSIGGVPVLNKLNSLSDSLASCIESSSSVPCAALVSAATPPTGAVPGNTIAAILDIALNPTNDVTQIYNLAGSTVAFQPTLSTGPPDWRLLGSTVQAAPVITWAPPAPIQAGTALTTAQLNATASVAGTFVYTPALGSVPAVGTDTLSVTFTPTDTTNYTNATASVSLVVNPLMPVAPTITWATPAPIVYGTPLSVAQLNATTSVPGTFVYTPAAGAILPVGTNTLSFVFTPTDTTTYSIQTGSVSLVLNKATPVITWPTPAPVSYGTALSSAQLDATSSVPGTFVYIPTAGTTPGAGSNSLSVTFTPTDAADYTTATKTTTLSVTQSGSLVTWTNPAPISYGTALSATQLNATASVPGTFVYSPTVGTIPATGTDGLSVTFTPTDTTNYAPETVTTSIVVNKATPTVTWSNPAPIAFGTPLSNVQLNATVTSTTLVPLSSYFNVNGITDGTAVSNGGFDGGGYDYSGNQLGTSISWNGVTYTFGPVNVNDAVSNITINLPQGHFASLNMLGALVNNAAASNIFSVQYTDGTTTNFTQSMSDWVHAMNYAGESNLKCDIARDESGGIQDGYSTCVYGYQFALDTTKIVQSVTLPTTRNVVMLAMGLTSSPIAGTMAYSPAAGSTPAAGTDTLSVTFTPTDNTTYSTVTATVSLVVSNVTPIVTWATPAAISYGTALTAAQLNATASVPGTFVYSPAGGAIPLAGTDTLSVTFTPTDTTDYASVTQTVSLLVNKSTPVVTWATPAAIAYGTTLSATQLNATASVPGTFVYSPAAGTTPAAGTDTLSVTFTPNDTVNYQTATRTVSLVVGGTAPVITWATPAAITYGTTLSATQLNATASVPGTFVYSPAAGSTPATGTDTLSVTFTPTDTTNYQTATRTVSLVVNKATPTVTWATPAGVRYGTVLSATQLNATASVPGAFVYSPAAGSTPATGTDTLSVTFTPTDTADYSTVTQTVSLAVSKAMPTVTWASPAAITYGTALSATQLNATASVPGAFVYSPAAGTTPATGTDTLSVTFTPTDTTDYNSQTASVALVVNGGSLPPATNIAIGVTAKVTGARRLGINLGGQTYYDSGQMLRNLIFRNPGFEGETFQTILKCASVTATSCTDSNIYDLWPANFVQGAQFTFLTGGAAGMTGTVTSSTGDSSHGQAVSISFAAPTNPPKVGDFVVVKWAVPGNAQAGWWTNTSGGAALTTEFADLSPNTPGKQALRITAAGVGQSASVTSYFDSYTERSFVQMNGTYQIAFRAKSVGGNNQMTVSLIRSTSTGNLTYFYETIALTPSWQDYTYDFPTAESGSSIGTVALAFNVSGANVLLDDVSLTPASSTPGNPTVFRDEVVSTLQTLHPGVLRYEDNGSAGLGNSIDNIIAPTYARVRAAYSTEQTEQDDVAIGLHEVLQLCQTIGAEPWYNVPVGITPTDMQHLIEYLAGDSTTPYGAKRAARGQVAPWTSVFPVIHLEIGNEVWNDTFHGESMTDPVAYGTWTSQLFAAAKSTPSYSQPSFDLILGSWAAVPWWTGQEMANSGNYDSVDAAPYLFNSLNDTSSNEAIFGPMFAQPEMVDDSPTGTMYLQAQTASAAGTTGVKPANLTVYEVNLSTLEGTASQSTINSVVPSIGAGITVIEHMLLMMRDLGVTVQNVYALPNYSNGFSNTAGVGGETVPLFGTVVDMGGETNLRRPIFLAEQMVNEAIMPNVLPTTASGANPTWNQPLSTNDNIQLNGAHEIQSFAFSDGGTSRSVVLVNLSRTTANSVTFSGPGAPAGNISVSQLTSANLTDTNESTANVNITNTSLTNFQPTTPYSLPPFSMTVFTWQAN